MQCENNISRRNGAELHDAKQKCSDRATLQAWKMYVEGSAPTPAIGTAIVSTETSGTKHKQLRKIN